MAKLLYIESSPRKTRSSSIAIANVFLNEYRKHHPKDEIVDLDLWKTELPAFDGDIIDAKYALMHGEAHTEDQAKAWREVEDVIAQFKEADKYVISIPMWNYGIPYKLKHYIDLITQPGYLFSFSPDSGYKGLVTGKKLLMITSRGGAYGAESGAQFLDYQIPYMNTLLKFVGFEDIESVVIEPTLASPEKKDQAIKNAKEQVLRIASSF